MGHPNFPPSLSIVPSVGRFTNTSPAEGDGGGAFGVEAQREAIARYGIAGRVWEAAYALCSYVEHDALDFDPPFVDDRDDAPLGVIELGSGTGVVAARIARAVRRTAVPGGRGFVIATDLPDVCPLLQHTLSPGTASADVAFVRPLAWGNLAHATAIAAEFGVTRSPASAGASPRLTHVVCSDLVYFPELLGPLLRTLIHLTSPSCVSSSSSPARVILSYKIRSLAKEAPFWTAFALWFSFEPVLARRRVRPSEGKDGSLDDESDVSEPWRQFGADDDLDRTFVFVAHRRPESIAWHVPETDTALMDGVGARGTMAKKGDDTFETILFMAMRIDDTGE